MSGCYETYGFQTPHIHKQTEWSFHMQIRQECKMHHCIQMVLDYITTHNGKVSRGAKLFHWKFSFVKSDGALVLLSQNRDQKFQEVPPRQQGTFYSWYNLVTVLYIMEGGNTICYCLPVIFLVSWLWTVNNRFSLFIVTLSRDDKS